jgi:hypothetical protein
MARPIALDFTEAERRTFWKRVKAVADVRQCWLLRGLKRGEYGTHQHRGKQIPSHRLAYAMAYGVDPGDMRCLHSCDDSRCQNPRHLRLGTDADNGADRVVASMMRAIAQGWRHCEPAHRRLPGIRRVTPPPMYDADGKRIDRRTLGPGKVGHAFNDVAQAIRWSYWNGCQDQIGLAAAFAVSPTTVANVLLRDCKQWLPPVEGEPDPGGKLATRAKRYAERRRGNPSGYVLCLPKSKRVHVPTVEPASLRSSPNDAAFQPESYGVLDS